MSHSHFLRQILEGLNQPLDGDEFELCACDLLRQSSYPSLACMPGGSDAGMDGTIADEQGKAFLVATTQESVIENLTRSLDSHLDHERPRRRVVLATSRSLTPERQRRLYDRASEKGFDLRNIHDQWDMALLLYRSPLWCERLLGIAGEPPALSLVPHNHRPLVNETLVGRQAEFEWLRNTSGDLLLTGQPGSGKTYLLHRFASNESGLFVVDDDREALANDLRVESPNYLIIDDAHLQPEIISEIRQLRDDLNGQFAIVAVTWPNYRDYVLDYLGIGSSHVHGLGLLSRDGHR